MNWESKNWVLALFLCLSFTLIAGYGVFLFGGDNTGCFEIIMVAFLLIELLIFVLCQIWKSRQNVLTVILLVVPILCIGVLFCCRKCLEKKPEMNQTCEALPSLEFTVQEGCSNLWKISASAIQVNCKQGETK